MAYSLRNFPGGVFTATVGKICLELARDEDAAELLSKGQTDLCFVGSDKLEEWSLAGRVASARVVDSVPIDCRMVLAGPASRVWGIPTRLGKGELLTVATSYPNLLGKFALSKGLNLAVTATPKGSCEAYAVTGRTDLVFDIKQSGNTLADNKMVVYHEGEQLRLNVLDGIELNDTTTDPLEEAMAKIATTYIERLRQARDDPNATSLTVELMRDPNKLMKKLFEEFGESVQALMRCPANKQEQISELADLLYPMGIYLALNGLTMIDVLKEDVRRNQPAIESGYVG